MNTSINDTQITPVMMAGLEAAAKAATPGPWVTSQAGHLNGAVICGNRHIAMVNYCVCREVDKRVTNTEDNAEYIVSAQPSVMLAMIAELRKLKAMCEWLSENVRSEGDYRSEERRVGKEC